MHVPRETYFLKQYVVNSSADIVLYGMYGGLLIRNLLHLFDDSISVGFFRGLVK